MGIGFGDDTRDPELPFQSMQSRDSRRQDRGRQDRGRRNTGRQDRGRQDRGRQDRRRSPSSQPQPFKEPATSYQPGPTLPQSPTSHPISYPDFPASAFNPINGSHTTKGSHTTRGQHAPQGKSAIVPLAAHYSPAPSHRNPNLNPNRNAKVIPVAAQSTRLSPSTHHANWITPLIWIHRSIGLATVALVFTALGFYGQSVYYQQQWGKHYRQLQQLKTLEHQGIAANEIMKQTLLEQAIAPGAAMQMPLPGTAIPIPKAPARELNVVEPPVPRQNLELETSAGY